MVGNSYNPVPTAESTGNLGSGFTVRSSPADFGSQVGAAVEKAGTTGFDIAIKEQGIANETAMTNADADFAIKMGKIKGDYTALSGKAAYDAFPQYQTDLKAAFDETRSTLNPAAQRGFDRLAARSMANHIADGSSYASSQLKEANRDAYSSLANTDLQALLDPQVAANKERSDYHLQSITAATQLQMPDDHPGLKADPETGIVRFDEATPEGKNAKAEFQRNLDARLSQAYVNRYDTLAKHDVFGAYDEYQSERDKMPRSAQVALDSSFAPRLQSAHVRIGTDTVLNQAQQEHWDMLTNPNKPVSMIMKNELSADGVVRVHSDGDGQAIGGINSESFPKQFAEAQKILNEKGQDAAKGYISNFYQKDIIEKNDIDKLPANVQGIVADGVANHWAGFQKELISAAKDGATPQQLIDMRRAEYQRLAVSNPEKYGQYLEGWNNRLDNLEVSTEGKKTYATNENGGPLTIADYYRTNSRDVLIRGDAYAESKMPGDLAFKRLVRQTLSNEMSRTISNETQQHLMDNRNVMKAINGELTKGKPPETEEELRAIPNMGDLLDNIAARDPKFAETIPTMIEKVQRRNETTNSSNGYDTILRALEPYGRDNPNAISSEDHLNRLLGRIGGNGISMKDYNDAKPLLEAKQPFKDAISGKMKEIAGANGNLDGKGQERAMTWYNRVMDAKKQNDARGDKGMKEDDFIKDGFPPASMPSRMGQLSDLAAARAKEKMAPIFSSPDNPEFAKLPSGSQFRDADGNMWTKK